MALIVETGAGLSNAESYESVAGADLYHSKRGNEAWADLSTEEKEIALRKATDYMLQVYRHRWDGLRKLITQALDWPRVIVAPFDYPVLDSIVPVEVKNACSDLALKSTTAQLLDDLTQQVLSETIGPITTVYDKASPQKTRYPAIDAMLSIYLKCSGNAVPMVRV